MRVSNDFQRTDLWKWLLGVTILWASIATLEATPEAKGNALLSKSDASVEVTKKCEGSIDSVNGRTPGSDVIEAGGSLNIRGWLAISTTLATVPEHRYLALRGAEGKWVFVDALSAERPDVGAYFGSSQLNSSGVESSIDTAGLSGDYSLSLAYSSGTSILVCDKISVAIRVSGLATPVTAVLPSILRENAEFTDRCEGNIESLNGETPPPTITKANTVLRASGWLVGSSLKGSVPDLTFLVLKSASGDLLIAEATRTDRSDVGTYFNNPALVPSGYEVTVDLSGLKGDYTVGLAHRIGGIVTVCNNFAKSLSILSNVDP